jgi:hypothetical protein
MMRRGRRRRRRRRKKTQVRHVHACIGWWRRGVRRRGRRRWRGRRRGGRRRRRRRLRRGAVAHALATLVFPSVLTMPQVLRTSKGVAAADVFRRSRFGRVGSALLKACRSRLLIRRGCVASERETALARRHRSRL